MSRYKVIATEFRQKDSLLQALTDCGLEYELAPDLHKPSIQLKGFWSDRSLSSIVVRHATLNTKLKWQASNDLGFAWDEKSKAFNVQVNDMDEYRLKSLLTQIKDRYNFREVQRLARQNGYTVRQLPTKDGVTRFQLYKTTVSAGSQGQSHSIDVNIGQDGKIEATVRGVQGPSCSNLSAWLDKLGSVEKDDPTPDFNRVGVSTNVKTGR